MARPKRVFTDEDEQKMYEYALSGCQNGTISTLMCIPLSTLVRRFGGLLREKRAERKYNLRKAQTDLSISNPAMAIFLGKNELDQKDKKEITDGKSIVLKDLTPDQERLVKEVAAEVMARERREHFKVIEAAESPQEAV